MVCDLGGGTVVSTVKVQFIYYLSFYKIYREAPRDLTRYARSTVLASMSRFSGQDVTMRTRPRG